jgi:hypothetical protein
VQARPPRKDLQDQQIEGTLERIGFWHTQTSMYRRLSIAKVRIDRFPSGVHFEARLSLAG